MCEDPDAEAQSCSRSPELAQRLSQSPNFEQSESKLPRRSPALRSTSPKLTQDDQTNPIRPVLDPKVAAAWGLPTLGCTEMFFYNVLLLLHARALCVCSVCVPNLDMDGSFSTLTKDHYDPIVTKKSHRTGPVLSLN